MRISNLVAYCLLAIATSDALFIDWSKVFGSTLPAAPVLPISSIIGGLPASISGALDVLKASTSQLIELFQKLTPQQITDFFTKLPSAQVGEIVTKIPQQAFDALKKFTPQQAQDFLNKIPAQILTLIPQQTLANLLSKLTNGQIINLLNKIPLKVLLLLDPVKYKEVLDKLKPLDLLNLTDLPTDLTKLKNLIGQFVPVSGLTLPTDANTLRDLLQKEVQNGAAIASSTLLNYGYSVTTIVNLGLPAPGSVPTTGQLNIASAISFKILSLLGV